MNVKTPKQWRTLEASERSLWLLRFTFNRMKVTGGGGYCNHLPLPSDAPSGVSMGTMRGLERRGLVEEFITGCFRPTSLGIQYLKTQDSKTNDK
jgi:hypothetical protein